MMYESQNKTLVSNTYSTSGTIGCPKTSKLAGAIQMLVPGISFDCAGSVTLGK